MYKKINQLFFLAFAVLFTVSPNFAVAQQASSGNYAVDEIFMGPGGSNDVSSTSFTARGTVGDTGVGSTSVDVAINNASSDVTTDIGGTLYRVVTWTSSGSISFSSSINVDYLIIGGGGGGGGNCISCGGAGGGGAGGYLSGSTTVASQVYTITVGAGGNGGQAGTLSSEANGANGQNSSAFSLTAIGGGGGRPQSGAAGANGGSGGGGSAGSSPPAGAGGLGTSGQGNNGSVGQSSAPFLGGGGGGSGSAGSQPSGGNGTSSSITGTAVTRAGGGAGGVYNATTTALGGSGGGGNGGNSTTPNGGDAVANTGSGGGGGNGAPNGGKGGNGGSGTVIVRWIASATSGSESIGGNTTSTNPELEVILNAANVEMGVFSPSAASTGTTTFSVRSYLSSGYAVYTIGNPPTTSGGADINPMTTGGTSSPGTEQFGINLVDNSNPDVGANPTQTPDNTFSFGYVATNYNTANNFRYNNGDIIARSDSSTGITTYTISYLVNVHPVTTPAGKYIFRQSIVVTPTF